MPKKTLDTILDSNNDYLIQTKANTPKLLSEIKAIAENTDCIDSDFTREPVNGRIDCRMVEVFDVAQGQISKGWNGIQRVIRVNRWDEKHVLNPSKSKERSRRSKNNTSKPTNGTHYYILSAPINSAKKIGTAIRNHWSIENKLHWGKDVYLQEDKMTIVDASASALVASLNNLVMNAIRNAGIKPSKDFFSKICNNMTEIFCLLRT